MLAAPGFSVAQSVGDAGGRVVDIDVPAPTLAGNMLDTPDIQGTAV